MKDYNFNKELTEDFSYVDVFVDPVKLIIFAFK